MGMQKPASAAHPIHHLIRDRWSPRAFLDKAVEPERLLSLLEAARWAPSSYNEQPWIFLVATKEQPEEFEKMLGCLVEGNQGWAKAAPVLMISVAKLSFTKNNKENRCALHDVGLASAMLTLQAVELGLVTHGMAGIEIENTIDADVYENTATGNTGGILVFNMPNLSQPGHSTRVFKNRSYENNLSNFAAKGAAVASVPAGSGIVVNSNPKVEIFDNDIASNKTANLIISSYFSTNYYNTEGVDPKYDPYPRAIFVYGNRFKGGGDSPDGLELKTLKTALFGINGRFPDVLWDGYVDSKNLVNGVPPAGERICVANGDVEVLNADGPNKYKNPKVDKAFFNCDLPKLAAVELPHTS